MLEFREATERAVSRHLGERWRAEAFTDLSDRASHRCGIFRGRPISVFAKLNPAGETDAELRGLTLLRRHAAAVPTPIGAVRLEAGSLLLHGDAQQNNFLTSEHAAYLVDVCPYYGHPELDLALLDYFARVPPVVFDAYREVSPIDDTFAERRELWRLAGYLAVVTVDGQSTFGRPFLDRIAAVVRRYG